MQKTICIKIFAVLLFACYQHAFAEVYKHIDAKGRVTYTDKPALIQPNKNKPTKAQSANTQTTTAKPSAAQNTNQTAQPLAATTSIPITTTPSDTSNRYTGHGRSNYIAYTTSNSSILPFLENPKPVIRAWLLSHVWRMFAFSPYYDNKLSRSPPAWLYKDAYAVYPTGNQNETMTLDNATEFILRDANGQLLYIPYDCKNGSCPQLAADIGNQAFRDLWIKQARSKLALGYKGIHVDDVNLDWRVSDGHGNFTAPIDPRTNKTMTLADWRRYFAEFTEQIRAAFPNAEIVHNSLWWVPDTDPFAARQLKAANIINIERGVVDDGLTHGKGPFGFETLLDYVDKRHAHGTNVLYFAYGTTQTACEYNLASYFLTSTGKDGTTCLYANAPDNWWKGYDVALGNPIGDRVKLANGVLKRNYEYGVVLVNQPGAPTVTTSLAGKFKTLAGANSADITTTEIPASTASQAYLSNAASTTTHIILSEKRGVILLYDTPQN